MDSLTNKNVLLGVTGGIAAYKSAEIVRHLKKSGSSVRVVMTKSAEEFITPLTLQALSGNRVSSELLDAEAEAAVQLGLRRAMRGRTVLVIAHRLATVQEADQIVVLERGRIVELGTHQELMDARGRYRDLCERQVIRGVEFS